MSSSDRSNSEREARRLDAQLLSDLWIFRAVARAGSISAAAPQLNVTAGAVSQRVLRLEARLRADLFRRQKGKIALTEVGSIVLDAMNGVSLTLNNALARLEHPQRASIVVSCSTSLAMEWLMSHLQEFYRECPDVELLLRSETTETSAAWMAAEGIDVRIHYTHFCPVDLVELASIQELTFPVCSRAYRSRLVALPPEERTAVALHDNDAWREGEPPRAEWQEWLAIRSSNCGFLINADRQFNLAYLAHQAAMYGQGIAIGRSVSVNGLLRAGKLVLAVDAPPVPSAHYRVLARTNHTADSPCGRFARWVERALVRTQKETITLLGVT